MNELFNELITEIMSLGEAEKKPATTSTAKKKPDVKRRPDGTVIKSGESEKYPGYYRIGGDYYSNVKKGGQTTHKTVDGNMVALTKPEQERLRTQRDKRGTDDYGKDIPVAQPRDVTPQQPSPTPTQPKVDIQQTIGDLEARTRISSLTEPKKQVVNGLIDALKPRDGETPEARVERVQKFITDNKILVGSTYRLKAGEIEKFIDQELSLKVFMALKNIGVTLTHKFDKPVDINALIAYGADKKASGAERFKPPVVFGDATDTLDLSVTETGIVVQGERIDTIAPDEETRLVQKLVEAARQSFGEKFTQEREDNIEKYVRARAREQNANIEWLKQVKETGGTYNKFPKNDESSESATTRMVDALSTLVDSHLPEDKREPAKQQLSNMASSAKAMVEAKTALERRDAVRAYSTAYVEFNKLSKGSDLGKNMKYVAESLKALHSVAQGKTVLIPSSDSFPLADIITIGKNPITGESSIELFIVSVEEGDSASVAESVKLDDGSAGVTHQKDGHSKFSTVRSTDGSEISADEVKRDLVGMGGVNRKNAIFTRDGKISSTEKTRITEELTKYGDVAREYFGLPTDPNAEGYIDTEQLYEFLSYGKAMVCIDGKPSPSKDGTRYSLGDEKQNRENAEQWQAWSVVGLVHEAVHNRTVTQQYYKTAQYTNSGLVIADGIRRMAKAVFQPFKNLSTGSEKNPRTGKAPDSSMVSFSVPSESTEDLQDRNPCNKKK